MNKIFPILIIMLTLSANLLFAQETDTKSLLRLKSGDVFTGTVSMKTSEFILFLADDGKRYQFQLSDIEAIEEIQQENKKELNDKVSNFGGIVELNGGMANASTPFVETSPCITAAIVLGSKKIFNTQTFAGLGVGIDAVKAKTESKIVSFLPVFIQIHKRLSNKTISPFVGIKGGYAFSLNKELNGGTLLQLSSGANINLTRRLSLNLGVFGKIQPTSGVVIEKNEWGDFLKQGSTPLYNFGLNIGFFF